MEEILKQFDIIQVENKDYHFFFKKFFKHIYLAKTNEEALRLYKAYTVPIIFLYCNQNTTDTIDSIKHLKEMDNDIIIIVQSYKKPLKKLLELISLGITGHFDEIYQKDKVQNILKNIYHHLPQAQGNIIFLTDNYIYDIQKKILYNSLYIPIKLTQNEKIILSLLTKKRNQYLSTDTIIYALWENNFGCETCYNRFKNILFKLRKKLPPNSIINSYQEGYKLNIQSH